LTFTDAPEGVLAFVREGGGERLTCVFDLTGEAQSHQTDGRLLDLGLGAALDRGVLHLPPWSGAVLA
jgi:alpha-glucosidase